MQVAVHFHGSRAGGATRLSLELPDDATADDLLRELGEHGLPLGELAGSGRLPRQLRVFAGGELVSRGDERLACDVPVVTVVLMSPIAGG